MERMRTEQRSALTTGDAIGVGRSKVLSTQDSRGGDLQIKSPVPRTTIARAPGPLPEELQLLLASAPLYNDWDEA